MQGIFDEKYLNFIKIRAKTGNLQPLCSVLQWIHSIKRGVGSVSRLLRKRKNVVFAVLLLALLGLIFRLTRVTALQVIVALLVFALAALSARELRPRRGFAVNHRPSPALLLPFPAALLLTVAALVQLFSGRWFAGIAELTCAVCLTVIVLKTVTRKIPPLPVYMILTVGIICKLIPDFRIWSVDPLLTDYCFRLFALIAVMLVAFHLGGFVQDDGNRRLTVFYAICGTAFSIISFADGGFAEFLTYLAYALFLLCVLWTLMRPGRRRKKRPAPPAEPQERKEDLEAADWNHLQL